MKLKRALIGIFMLSVILFLVLIWHTSNTKQPKIQPSSTIRPVRAWPTVIKDKLVLNDGHYNYHLNLTSFKIEFPYLQSYRCNLILSPRPEGNAGTDDKLVILAVKSHPNSRGRRAALRQTWATKRVMSSYRLRPVFLLGKTPVAELMEVAEHESQEYGNVLQWDLMEGHHNLSLKERCFLEWLHWNSSHVYYIFKGDDEVFGNPEMIVRYITEHGTANTVHGYHQHCPLERYPGFVFLFPGAAVKSLYEASQLLPVFPLDDVYFGFLTLAANLSFRHDPRFYVYGLDYDVYRYKQALMVHSPQFQDLTEIWRNVQKCEVNMKYRGGLIIAYLVSMVIILGIKWNKINLTKTSPTTRATPPPISRQSVTLVNGSHTYHLNLTAFEEEFPHLQSYRCTLIQKPEVRSEAADKLVILAVKSQPSAGVRRAALRNTWATERVVLGYRLRPVFLMGESAVAGHMEMVKLESRVYGDILQWDIAEGHHNLSLKERCCLEWLHLNLPQTHFIFKGDNDVFVNPEMVVRYISERGTANTVHGYHQHRPLVMRKTKYQISKTLYPQERYPGFVSGGGFLFPGAAVKSLYEASQLLPVFPLDDVYFGLLVLATNMTYRHDARFHVYGLKYEVCLYKHSLVVHGIDPKRMVEIWREVRRADCNGTRTEKRMRR
ncbi:uncharacterized protein PAF06_010350 [Gastrophryne carolinensis]